MFILYCHSHQNQKLCIKTISAILREDLIVEIIMENEKKINSNIFLFLFFFLIKFFFLKDFLVSHSLLFYYYYWNERGLGNTNENNCVTIMYIIIVLGTSANVYELIIMREWFSIFQGNQKSFVYFSFLTRTLISLSTVDVRDHYSWKNIHFDSLILFKTFISYLSWNNQISNNSK